MAQAAGGPKPPTKTQILASLAEATEKSKKEVQEFLDALTGLISNEMAKKGSGAFTLPGLLKIVRQNKPALPRREVRGYCGCPDRHCCWRLFRLVIRSAGIQRPRSAL